MGLPVWREATVEEAQVKADPTALRRSSIRRAERRPYPRFHRTDSSNAIPRANADSPGSAARYMEYAQRLYNEHQEREPEVSAASVRPHSRRGPTIADVLDGTSESVELPPLRRMGHRSVAEEGGARSARRRTRFPPPTSELNGLGDRQRSESIPSETDAWAMLGTTITSDPNLPSASTSFASAEASAPNNAQPVATRSTSRDHTDDPIEWPESPSSAQQEVLDAAAPENCDLPATATTDLPPNATRQGPPLQIPHYWGPPDLRREAQGFEDDLRGFIRNNQMTMAQRGNVLVEMRRALREAMDRLANEANRPRSFY